MVKYTGRGLVVKWPGVLSKVQMLNLVLGVGVFSLLGKEAEASRLNCNQRNESEQNLIMTCKAFEGASALHIPKQQST